MILIILVLMIQYFDTEYSDYYVYLTVLKRYWYPCMDTYSDQSVKASDYGARVCMSKMDT